MPRELKVGSKADQIRKLSNSGMTHEQISKKVNCYRQYVTWVLAKQQASRREPLEKRVTRMEQRLETILEKLGTIAQSVNDLYAVSVAILELPDDQLVARVKEIRSRANQNPLARLG